MSGLSEVSTHSTTAVKNVFRRATNTMGKRLSLWMGYRNREDSITHGLYNDLHFSDTIEDGTDSIFVTEMFQDQPIETSGNLKLKLTYMFMFVEWLIFCAVFIQFTKLLPSFFKLFTNF